MSNFNEQTPQSDDSNTERIKNARIHDEMFDRVTVPNEVMMVSEIIADYLEQSGYRFSVGEGSASRTIRFERDYITADEIGILLKEYENPRTVQEFDESTQTLTISSQHLH